MFRNALCLLVRRLKLGSAGSTPPHGHRWFPSELPLAEFIKRTLRSSNDVLGVDVEAKRFNEAFWSQESALA